MCPNKVVVEWIKEAYLYENGVLGLLDFAGGRIEHQWDIGRKPSGYSRGSSGFWCRRRRKDNAAVHGQGGVLIIASRLLGERTFVVRGVDLRLRGYWSVCRSRPFL